MRPRSILAAGEGEIAQISIPRDHDRELVGHNAYMVAKAEDAIAEMQKLARKLASAHFAAMGCSGRVAFQLLCSFIVEPAVAPTPGIGPPRRRKKFVASARPQSSGLIPTQLRQTARSASDFFDELNICPPSLTIMEDSEDLRLAAKGANQIYVSGLFATGAEVAK